MAGQHHRLPQATTPDQPQKKKKKKKKKKKDIPCVLPVKFIPSVIYQPRCLLRFLFSYLFLVKGKLGYIVLMVRNIFLYT
jgi:hypothetical protein